MLLGVALIPTTKLTGLWIRRYLVFGVELEFLLEREADGAEVLPGTIPSAIASCSCWKSRPVGRVKLEFVSLSFCRGGKRRCVLDRIAGATFWDIYAIGDMIKSFYQCLCSLRRRTLLSCWHKIYYCTAVHLNLHLPRQVRYPSSHLHPSYSLVEAPLVRRLVCS